MPIAGPTSSGSQLPVSVSDMIAATRDLLMGTYSSEWNLLAADMDAPAVNTVETITLQGDIAGAVRTVYLSIDDEILYVMSNPGLKQCQVIRGWDGTVPAVHTAGTPIEVATRFPRHRIRRALALEIGSWPDNLFQVRQVSLTLVNDGRTTSYDLGVPAAQVLFLLDVRHAPWLTGQSRNSWPQFQQPPRLNRTVDTAAFPSGIALDIKNVIETAVECVVTYATGFDLSSLDDTVLLGPGGIGLANTMLDIPPLGAAAKLIGPREALRTFAEASDSARNTQDVQPGSAMKVGMYLKAERDKRIKEEMEHLNVLWPARSK